MNLVAFLRRVQLWVRCGRHTGWSHEVDFHTGRCRFCHQKYAGLAGVGGRRHRDGMAGR
jgi:hypothetical protein